MGIFSEVKEFVRQSCYNLREILFLAKDDEIEIYYGIDNLIERLLMLCHVDGEQE